MLAEHNTKSPLDLPRLPYLVSEMWFGLRDEDNDSDYTCIKDQDGNPLTTKDIAGKKNENHTHRVVAVHDDITLDEIFEKQQGENWSPNGEKREYLQSKGLTHTSMSTGDVVWDLENDVMYLCTYRGWKIIPNE